LIGIENKFAKLKDSLAEANADIEPSRGPASEDPFSLPAAMDPASCEAGMSLRVNSDVSTRAESVQARSILSLTWVLEELREEDKEDVTEERAESVLEER
jgi:hypothetical protein